MPAPILPLSGIMISGKGASSRIKVFPRAESEKNWKKRPDLHFITSIKRNDVRTSDNDMLSYEGILKVIEGHVLYKKKQIKGGRCLYAYKHAGKLQRRKSFF